MKNSAWYTKLWRKKLNELPVKGDAGSAWANMKDLLDKQMPVQHHELPELAKPLVAKIFTLLGYVLPAAAMIGTVTYLTMPKHVKQDSKAKKQQIHNNRTYQSNHKTITADSILLADSTAIVSQTNPANKESNRPIMRLNDSSGNTKSTVLNTKVAGLNTSPARRYALTDKQNSKSLPVKTNNKRHTNSSNSNLVKTINTRTNNKPYRGPVVSPNNYKENVTSSKDAINNASKSNLNTGLLRDAGKQVDPPGKNQLNPTSTSETADTAANQVSGNMAKDTALANTPLNNLDVKDTLKKESPAVTKSNKVKPGSNKVKQALVTPPYNYGIEAGLNAGSRSNIFAGIFANYALSKNWIIGAGLRVNTPKQLSGSYNYPITYRPDSVRRKDSLVNYTITDKRKVLAMDIPLGLEYRVNKFISLKAAPVISFAIGQSNKSSSISPLGNLKDSTYRSKGIDSAIAKTTLNKVNFGFNGGVNFYLNHFGIEGRYQFLNPYKVSNSLGSYNQTNKSFQISLTYRFK